MLAWVLAGRPLLAFSWAWPATLLLGGAVPGLATFAHGLMALIHCPPFSARSAIKIRKAAPSSVVHHTDAATSISVGLPQLRENQCHPENRLSGTHLPWLTDLSVAP